MDILTVSSLTLNTIGSILLAFALNSTTKMQNNSLTALEHFKETYLSGGDVLSIIGMDIQRKKAFKNTRLLTNIGLTLLILGFVLQIISLITIKPAHSSTNKKLTAQYFVCQFCDSTNICS